MRISGIHNNVWSFCLKFKNFTLNHGSNENQKTVMITLERNVKNSTKHQPLLGLKTFGLTWALEIEFMHVTSISLSWQEKLK